MRKLFLSPDTVVVASAVSLAGSFQLVLAAALLDPFSLAALGLAVLVWLLPSAIAWWSVKGAPLFKVSVRRGMMALACGLVAGSGVVLIQLIVGTLSRRAFSVEI